MAIEELGVAFYQHSEIAFVTKLSQVPRSLTVQAFIACSHAAADIAIPDPAGFGEIDPETRHKRCSSASVRRGSQKVADETCYRCRMLEVRRMTGARDDVDPRTGEALRELVRVY